MGTVPSVLIGRGAGAWLALMVLAAMLPLAPGVLAITRPLVCRRGESLEIVRTKASYHRPGETGLVVRCVGGPSGPRNVRFRAILALWAGMAMILAALALLTLALAGGFR